VETRLPEEQEGCCPGLNSCFRVCKGGAPRVSLVDSLLEAIIMQGDRFQVAQICWARTVNSC